MGCDGPCSRIEIFLYDGISTSQITSNSYDEDFPPISNNGYVIWHGYDGNDYEIFVIPVAEMEAAGYGAYLEPFIKAGLYRPKDEGG